MNLKMTVLIISFLFISAGIFPSISGLYSKSSIIQSLSYDEQDIEVNDDEGDVDFTQIQQAIDDANYGDVIWIIYPNGNEKLNGNVIIQWDCSDELPFLGIPYFFIYYKGMDSGWHNIIMNLPIEFTSLPWDTELVPDGDYIVRAELWFDTPPADGYGDLFWGGDNSDDWFTIDNNDPPDKPSIGGIQSGKINIAYNFTIGTEDPNGDDVSYYIDWGDGNEEGWYGPFSTEYEIFLDHTWTIEGAYTIRAKAKDIYDVESEWATLDVSMPKNKINNLISLVIGQLIQRFPILEFLL